MTWALSSRMAGDVMVIDDSTGCHPATYYERLMMQRIAELEAALKPFAACLVYEQHGDQWSCRLELARITRADFARAENLLRKTTE